ncbi:cytochrome c [Asaia prunellae]|uniref:cytochrome c n=1 Tax=Asaia prunellae TaxID=610245 RepID=UPI00054D0BD3|nr:cytochrome c [Asaia prunellae]
MPAFRHDLTDRQILALVQFVTHRLAGSETTLTEAEITKLRHFDTEDFPAQALPAGSASLNMKSEKQTQTQ